MEEKFKNEYIKQTRQDYSMSFNLQVVQEGERGELIQSSATRKYGIQAPISVRNWLRKYGSFDWENQTTSHMPKSPEQKILELQQQVKYWRNKKPFWKSKLKRRIRNRSLLI
jgi:transposase